MRAYFDYHYDSYCDNLKDNDLNEYRMNKMHDPYDIYPNIFKNTHLENSWRNMLVNIPDVRDEDGKLIMPHEYRSKMKDGTIVMVNGYLKLYVFYFPQNFFFKKRY